MASPNPKPSESHSVGKRQREEYQDPKKSRRSSAWAELPQELAEAILGHLTLEDYLPFGLVCKSWWSAMVAVRSLLKPPPLLILKPGMAALTRLRRCPRAMDAQSTRFYSLRGPSFRPHPLNAADLFRSARCCGSSMGWLFMVGVDDGSRLHLLNPASSEAVGLPPLPPHLLLWGWDAVLCSEPASHPDCIVAVKCTVHASLSTVFLACRPKRDAGWMEIPYRGSVSSFALHEARLYVISPMHVMDVYHLDPVPGKTCSVRLADGIPRMTDLSILGGMLAVVDGRLLLVLSDLDGPRPMYEFVDSCRWVKIRSLGDWVLLLNPYSAQAFSTKESPTSVFRANCIYQQSHDSIFVYSLEDESSMAIPPPIQDPLPEKIWQTGTGYCFQAYWFLAQSW